MSSLEKSMVTSLLRAILHCVEDGTALLQTFSMDGDFYSTRIIIEFQSNDEYLASFPSFRAGHSHPKHDPEADSPAGSDSKCPQRGVRPKDSTCSHSTNKCSCHEGGDQSNPDVPHSVTNGNKTKATKNKHVTFLDDPISPKPPHLQPYQPSHKDKYHDGALSSAMEEDSTFRNFVHPVTPPEILPCGVPPTEEAKPKESEPDISDYEFSNPYAAKWTKRKGFLSRMKKMAKSFDRINQHDYDDSGDSEDSLETVTDIRTYNRNRRKKNSKSHKKSGM